MKLWDAPLSSRAFAKSVGFAVKQMGILKRVSVVWVYNWYVI